MFRSYLPRLEMQVLAAVGHDPILEKPDAVNAALSSLSRPALFGVEAPTLTHSQASSRIPHATPGHLHTYHDLQVRVGFSFR
jgi:hypothetical protein